MPLHSRNRLQCVILSKRFYHARWSCKIACRFQAHWAPSLKYREHQLLAYLIPEDHVAYSRSLAHLPELIYSL